MAIVNVVNSQFAHDLNPDSYCEDRSEDEFFREYISPEERENENEYKKVIKY